MGGFPQNRAFIFSHRFPFPLMEAAEAKNQQHGYEKLFIGFLRS